MGDALLNYKVNEGLMSDEVKLFEGNQQPRRKRRGIKPSARIKYGLFGTTKKKRVNCRQFIDS